VSPSLGSERSQVREPMRYYTGHRTLADPEWREMRDETDLQHPPKMRDKIRIHSLSEL
jgi:hypothetical protein